MRRQFNSASDIFFDFSTCDFFLCSDFFLIFFSDASQRDASLIPPLIEDLEREENLRNQQLKSARADSNKKDKHKDNKDKKGILSLFPFLYYELCFYCFQNIINS